jgi:hypothetical protein
MKCFGDVANIKTSFLVVTALLSTKVVLLVRTLLISPYILQ